MSPEGMDQNPEILEREAPADLNVNPGEAVVAREWPGVSRENETAPVTFPGEDGGKSLARMAERDLMAAVQLLAERAQYITGATGAAIALRDGDEMVCRASAGGSAPEIGARLQMDSGLSGESIRTRQLLRCNDAQTDGRVNQESCEALGIASVVVMPMLDGGEVIGVFELFSDRAYAFEDRDIVALERMGAMVRTALEQTEAPMSAGQEHEAPAPAEAGAQKEFATSEKSEATFAPPAKSDGVEAKLEEPAFAQDALRAATGTPIVNEAEELLDAEPFLSVPEDASSLKDSVGTAKPEEIVEASEPDVGELARDAAARTEAWKASLFASDAPAKSGTSSERESAGRIAFHARIPRKVEALPVEADMPEVVASLEAASSKKQEWETPIAESASPSKSTSAVEEGSSADVIASGAEISERRDEPTVHTPDVVIDRGLPVVAASAGSGAAVAPAREALSEQVALEAKAEQAATIPAEPATGSLSKEEAPKPRIEIARPASSEGRAKIAVAQVRKCEACGFPVSEGRKLCLDCEKKPQKAEASTKPTVASEPATATVTKTVEVTTPAEPLGASLSPEAAVTALKETSSAVVKVPEAVPKEENLEIRKNEAVPGARELVAELPAPQFMVNAPDHYESWIISHIYTAVAIAVVAVGIVVYLLSR